MFTHFIESFAMESLRIACNAQKFVCDRLFSANILFAIASPQASVAPLLAKRTIGGRVLTKEPDLTFNKIVKVKAQ